MNVFVLMFVFMDKWDEVCDEPYALVAAAGKSLAAGRGSIPHVYPSLFKMEAAAVGSIN
jgi:hypothetical protein